MADIFKNRKIHRKPEIEVKTNYSFIDTKAAFNKHYDEMMRLGYWVTDTETTGLDCHEDEVILLQVGDRDRQFLIDTREVEIDRMKERFEDEDYRKYLQNAIFDYKMLKGSKGITMEGIMDTMIAEQILTMGIQKWGFGMGDMAKKYLGVELDKELQTSFIGHTGPFSRRQLEYAALDCVIPDWIFRYQAPLLQSQGLIDVFKLECNAIPAFGDIEFYGLLLDEVAWEQNILAEQSAANKARKDFLDSAAKHLPADLFGAPDINPASPAQVLEYFKKRFPIEDLQDRDGKAGTGAEILGKIIAKYTSKDCPEPKDVSDVQALLKVREHEKKVGTYGYTYIRHVHPKTGRFHPRIAQIGTDTGRPAGKKPNMLNVPAEARYRHPWIGGAGRKILTNDYGACELRIMASMSDDPVMCKGFNEGLDYHTYTAGEFITDPNEFKTEFIPHPKEPGKGKYGERVLDENGNPKPNSKYQKLVGYDFVTKAMRTVAKVINFGLAYGMGVKKLADTLSITRDLSREYITKFNVKFEVLVTWLKRNQDRSLEPRSCTYDELLKAKNKNKAPVLNLGYSESHLGRKRYFAIPKVPKMVQYSKDFYPDDVYDPETGRYVKKWRCDHLEVLLDYNPGDPWDENLPDSIRKYYSRLAGIKREGGNFPIQGGNADITKIAMYELRKRIKIIERDRNDGQYLAHVALQVYDEILVDCPEEMAEEMAKLMDEIMREAGSRVIEKVPVETDCLIADSWIKG
jgi:DNA polymerase I-like protein with 3'-5' exonuclease and polymerase domains